MNIYQLLEGVNSLSLTMIPKIIHQIWIGDFHIPKREQELIKNIQILHPDYEYKFWKNYENDLPINIKYWYDRFYKIKNYVFCADLIRIWVVYKYGGFYLDIDFDIHNKLDNFLNFYEVLFYHNDTDFTIPNNIFAAQKQSKMLKYCIDNIKENNSWYGPSWFGKVIKEYFNFPYESPQQPIKDNLSKQNIEYYEYWAFEKNYGKHLSLYSWSPEVWNKLNDNQQL